MIHEPNSLLSISEEVVVNFKFTHSYSEIIKKFRRNFGGVLNNPYLRLKNIREIYHIEKNSGTNIKKKIIYHENNKPFKNIRRDNIKNQVKLK